MGGGHTLGVYSKVQRDRPSAGPTSICSPRAFHGRGVLGESSPHAFCCPPDELAAKDDNQAERKPSVETGGHETRAEQEHGQDHCEVERPREATMSAPAASGVHEACRALPSEGERPNH